MLEDFGPLLARFNSIEVTTDGPQKRWFPGFHSPLTLTFSIIPFIIMVVIIIRCGLMICAKKSGITRLCGQWTQSQEPDTYLPLPNSAPDSCETLDMEAEMQRVERDIHNPQEDPEENHFSIPNNHLKEVLKHVHESAVACAFAAHESDLTH